MAAFKVRGCARPGPAATGRIGLSRAGPPLGSSRARAGACPLRGVVYSAACVRASAWTSLHSETACAHKHPANLPSWAALPQVVTPVSPHR